MDKHNKYVHSRFTEVVKILPMSSGVLTGVKRTYTQTYTHIGGDTRCGLLRRPNQVPGKRVTLSASLHC